MTNVELKDGAKHITLPCYNMIIILIDEELHALAPSRWVGGSITSDLKEVCKHCEDPECNMGCFEFGEYCTDRDEDAARDKDQEGIEFRAHRLAVNAIESMVLAHAMAGLSIEEPAYIEGIKTALDALGNNT